MTRFKEKEKFKHYLESSWCLSLTSMTHLTKLFNKIPQVFPWKWKPSHFKRQIILKFSESETDNNTHDTMQSTAWGKCHSDKWHLMTMKLQFSLRRCAGWSGSLLSVTVKKIEWTIKIEYEVAVKVRIEQTDHSTGTHKMELSFFLYSDSLEMHHLKQVYCSVWTETWQKGLFR